MRRDPKRPKAAQLEAKRVLRAVDRHNERTGPWPPEAADLAAFPKKVIICKLRKLEKQGLVRSMGYQRYSVTDKGRDALQ